ncbi:TlpA family protein disulfide reductase [Kordia sp.]|uniref:TlpA family protein disulfide reductase n=1 Tax=Kordia sp. TaxID=1965332 RepID=UPI003B5BE9B1
MKKLLLLLICISVISCANEPKVDYTLFSGKIENQKDDKIVLINDGFKKEIKLNDDGTFIDTLRVETSYYKLYHGQDDITLFITNPKDLSITTDAKKFVDSMRYKGKGAAENMFLWEKTVRNKTRDAVAIFSQEEADFIKTINGFKEEASEKLKEATNLDQDFITYETKGIKFAHLINLSKYPMYYPYYSKNEDYKPSEELMAYFKDVDYDNEENYKMYSTYRQLALQHYGDKINPTEDAKGAINMIKGLKSKGIKDALVEELSYYISPSGKDSEFIYTSLSEISNDEKFKEELTKKYNTIKKLVAGKNSPDFNYENHKGGKTSLADLKGKYVYIDVWATWCGPCIAEIPSLKKVEKQYHNKDIQFVSISIDQQKAHKKWKTMVDDKELGGIQLMADNDWKSQFVVDYAIEGIPRFILIDPNGKIVNADAPRPSDPKLIELFNELKI